MTKRTKIAVVGVSALAIAGAGTGVAVATGDDNGGDTPITGAALDRAEAAALKQVPGGRVTETEMGEAGGSQYEVEVKRANGDQVELQLDRRFDVVGSEADDDSPGEADQE